jgi:hypothetical protein
MSEFSSIIYTRDYLKGLKAETDRQIHKQNVERLVQEIRNCIIATARSTDKTSFFKKYIQPNNNEDPSYSIMVDAIDELKRQFIDVSIEYKFQTDMRTGKEFNHGIYIDWS